MLFYGGIWHVTYVNCALARSVGCSSGTHGINMCAHYRHRSSFLAQVSYCLRLGVSNWEKCEVINHASLELLMSGAFTREMCLVNFCSRGENEKVMFRWIATSLSNVCLKIWFTPSPIIGASSQAPVIVWCSQRQTILNHPFLSLDAFWRCAETFLATVCATSWSEAGMAG